MNITYQKDLLYPEILWERPVHYYKAKAGRVFLLAGSKTTSNIGILLSEAVFRSGTGILAIGFPNTIQKVYQGILPEAMMLPLPSTVGGALAKNAFDVIVEQTKSSDAAVIGPGLSENAETIQLIWELIFKIEIPVVLVSDGVASLIKGIDVLRSKETEKFTSGYLKNRECTLTIVCDRADIERVLRAARLNNFEKGTGKWLDSENGTQRALETIAHNFNLNIVLDTNDEVIYLNNEDMIITRKPEKISSKKNLLNILAGIIGSFTAQNPNKLKEATVTAIYLYTRALSKASANNKDNDIKESDILNYLPQIIKEAENI